ncbi:unnamed protein product [Cuscuta epithymum]|uniref:Uncharacterized protein n=1 Tax=Cuscuta epithymum TaxID=186058 RepID=A0AAV0EVP3_9ASTE|nr:unnamed protein product [Cuscuta epithymum]
MQPSSEDLITQMQAQMIQVQVQMTQMKSQMTQEQAQMQAQFDLMQNQILMLGAETKAARARAYNATRLDNIRPVVKIMSGHPAPNPPQHFNFDQTEYVVGANPPIGLVPDNFNDICHLEHDQLDCIHWFYNEPSLVKGSYTLLHRHGQIAAYLMA